jgi:Uma2 family endonuclease
VFLLVDPEDNTVEVYLEPGKADSVLRPGETLRLSLFGTEAEIPVSAIFSGITLSES